MPPNRLRGGLNIYQYANKYVTNLVLDHVVATHQLMPDRENRERRTFFKMVRVFGLLCTSHTVLIQFFLSLYLIFETAAHKAVHSNAGVRARRAFAGSPALIINHECSIKCSLGYIALLLLRRIYPT